MAQTTALDVFNQYQNDRPGFIRQMGGDPADAGKMWDAFDKIKRGGSTTTTNTYNPIKIAADKIKNTVGDVIRSGESSGYIENDLKSLSQLTEKAIGYLASITNPLELGKELLGDIFDETLIYYKQQSDLVNIINKQAGLTGYFAENVREELSKANPELLRFGITFNDLAGSAKSVVDNSGRFLALNRSTWKETGIAASAYVGTLSDLVAMFPQFEKVGIGAGDVSKQIDIVGKRSIELGLQAQKTTKELNSNLGKLNEYGFKNGVQGLAEMVRRSTELRFNMGEVFKIAEKVFEPEGAIDLAANLQAIGGAIGDFNDPLKLMYMATNNVEGLGTALEGVAGSLATYNQEQGRFEITGVNLRRARALAKELGVEYGELANMAVASAERSSAAADLMATGLSLDEDQKRFITNIATMKDGKMQIELQSDKLQGIFKTDRIALEDLSKEQVDQLINLQDDFKKLDKEKIVQKQATDIENIGRNLSFLVAVARERAVKEGEGFISRIVKMAGFDPAEVLRKTNETINKGIVDLGESIKSKPDLNKENIRSKSEIQPTTKLTEENMKSSSFDSLKAMYEATQASVNNKTITQDVNFTFRSDTVFDPFAREMINRQDVISEIKDKMMDGRSYLNNENVYRV